MAKFVPKGANEDAWQPMVQHIDYGVLCNPEDHVYFRFGPLHGYYIEVAPTESGWVVNSLDFVSGSPTLAGKLNVNENVVIGRTGDCQVKIQHGLVSRQHLSLSFFKNILIAHDLGSTNGTYMLKSIPHFDIAAYIKEHPVEKAQESTLDHIHEAFGPMLDDFLLNYSKSKGQ